MATSYSPELTSFIEQELATGNYEDMSALVTEALEVFCEMKKRHLHLADQINQSLEDARVGRVASFNVEDLISELETELDGSGQPTL